MSKFSQTMIWFGKSFIKFVIKLLSTQTCSLASALENILCKCVTLHFHIYLDEKCSLSQKIPM